MRSPLEDPQFLNLYEVVGPLGRGGMGEVVRIRHRVWEIDLAAKIPLVTTMASTGGFPQLRREAETWIRLPGHPHVVTCHYVRTFGDTPVIFIEFVEGGSLAHAIEKGAFKKGATTETLVNQALSIALDIAHGLAHAHAANVVHQDVKPSNVLLDEHGAKITDFGIANLGKSEMNEGAISSVRGRGTMVATVVGMTPLYASPEQLATLRKNKPTAKDAITRASDIWSLGLTLLETLTGKASWQPGHVDHVLDKPAALWEDAVDLLQRMLAQDPAARPKATDVADELLQMLARRGVQRTPPTGTEMRADALNNRAVSLLDLDQREEAQQNLREALAIDPCHPEAVFNDTLLAWRAGDITDRGALDRVRQAISTNNEWEAKLLEAWIHIECGDEKGAWSVLDRVAETAAGAVRGTRAVARASRAVRDSIRETKSFRAAPGIADALALSHDERRVIVGSRDGYVRVFDLATGRQEHAFHAHNEYVFGVAMSRNGRYVYSGGWDNVFTSHDLESGKRVFQDKQPGKISTLILAPNEKKAWTGDHNGNLRAWSLTKRKIKQTHDIVTLEHDASVQCVALTPDGKTLLMGGEDNFLRWFNAETGELCHKVKLSSHPHSLAFAQENGKTILLVGRGNQQITLHDPETGDEIGALRNLQSWVSEIAVSPAGSWVVCSNGLHWCLWDLPARRCIRTFTAPNLITGAQFLSNGELLTLDWGGYIRRYTIEMPSQAPMVVALPRRSRELAAGRVSVDAALREATTALEAGHLAKSIAAAKRARDAQGFERAPDVLNVWEQLGERATRKGIRTVWPVDRWGPIKASSGMALDPSGSLLATADGDGKVTVWSVNKNAAPQRRREFTFSSDELSSRALSFSENGERLAVGTYKRLHVFSMDGDDVRITQEPRGYVRDVAFGPEDKLVAALDDHGHAHVFRTEDMGRMATVRGPENWVNAVAFVSDDRFVVGDYDGHVLLWDVARAAESGFVPGDWSSSDRKPEPAQALIRELNKYAVAGQQSISTIRVRDGRVYFGCADKALHVLDVETGQQIRAFTGHNAAVSCFDFLDEHHIVTGSFDKLVRIFDMRTGACLAVVEGHTHTIWDVVALGPNRFLTASDDDQIRRYHVDWELEAPSGK